MQQFIIGLLRGLAALDEPRVELSVLALAHAVEWLRPYAGEMQILASGGSNRAHPIKRWLGRQTSLRRAWHQAQFVFGRAVPLPQSDGSAEASGAHIIHFPKQDAFLTELPNIYHPWDLQHIHLPHFFTKREIQVREVRYRLFCERATIVCVASEWVKLDLIRQYDIPAQKIHVVPVASVLDHYAPLDEAQLTAIKNRYHLPERFIYYPAQTWPHKNHAVLFESLAILRDRRGLKIPLVLSGTRNEHAPALDQLIRRWRVHDQVIWLGYVDASVVQALYHEAQMLVFPSRFEGWGLPISEAMSCGLPVIASRVTSIPDLLGDAGVLLAPDDAMGWAEAIYGLWMDEAQRQTLSARAKQRAAKFSWARTARHMIALYKLSLGHPLSHDESVLVGKIKQSR